MVNHRWMKLVGYGALVLGMATLAPSETVMGAAANGGPVQPLGPTAITVGGGWRAFSWGAGAPVTAPDSPFTFSHSSSVVVTVVDVACVGDEFTIVSQGVPLAYSTKVTQDPECNDPSPTLDPAVALDRVEYSRAVFLLSAGTHSLDVQITTNMSGTRTAHIRVDTGSCEGSAGAGAQAANPNRGRAGRVGPMATALTVGGGWVPFQWGAGLPACAEDGPYTFSHTDSVKVTVVDTVCRGNRFRVLEGTTLVEYTSLVGVAFCPDAADTEDPDTALAAGTYSKGTFTLPAEAHALAIQAIANPHGAGLGFIRVDAQPANPCTFGSGRSSSAGRGNVGQGAVTINGGWAPFVWGTGAPACSTDGPFTFTSTAQVDVKVTTAGCRGAALKVYSQSGGTLLQTTPGRGRGPCPAPGDTTTADTAFADASYSHAAFTLPAGTHALAIEATANPFGGGSGFLRVDGPTGTVGGKNLTITTGNPDLRWDAGTAQTAYYIVRAPITPPAAAELLGPVGPAEVSYDDATVPAGTFNCYLVAPLDGNSTLGLGDLLCAFDGLSAGSIIPGAFTLGLNQSPTATL